MDSAVCIEGRKETFQGTKTKIENGNDESGGKVPDGRKSATSEREGLKFWPIVAMAAKNRTNDASDDEIRENGRKRSSPVVAAGSKAIEETTTSTKKTRKSQHCDPDSRNSSPLRNTLPRFDHEDTREGKIEFI